MKKNLLYRLFGIGGVPMKIRPVLEEEGIVLADEGIAGTLVMRNIKGPGRRFIHRREGFLGCLLVTSRRLLACSFGKRQINIALDDPRLGDIYLRQTGFDRLAISFEAAHFREGWQGVMEFRFKTEKASDFNDKLLSLGLSKGTAPDREENEEDG